MGSVLVRSRRISRRMGKRWREHAAPRRNLRNNSTAGLKWSSISAAGESNFTSLSSTAAFAADTTLMAHGFRTKGCARAGVGRLFVRAESQTPVETQHDALVSEQPCSAVRSSFHSTVGVVPAAKQ